VEAHIAAGPHGLALSVERLGSMFLELVDRVDCTVYVPDLQKSVIEYPDLTTSKVYSGLDFA
jgi:hypothetical protein